MKIRKLSHLGADILVAVVAMLAYSIAYGATTPVEIGVYNQSTLPDSAVIDALAAVQVQLDRDYMPAFHVHRARVLTFNASPRPRLRLYIVDGLLGARHTFAGFHFVDRYGPYAMVSSSFLLSILISHEVLEMLNNPRAAAHHAEICDGLRGSYYINGLQVVDFRFPPKMKQTFCGANEGICAP